MCLTKLFPGGEVGWDCGGCWGITRSLAARVCQPPSPLPQETSWEQAERPSPAPASPFPHSLMRGQGVLMRRLLKSREAQGPPPAAWHCIPPGVPTFLAPWVEPLAPGCNLLLLNPQTLLQPRLGFQEPFRVCHTSRPWDNLLLQSGSPLPLFIWLLPPPAAGLPQPLSDPVDPPRTAVIRLYLAPD